MPLQFSEKNNHSDLYLGTVLWELKLVPTTLQHTGSVSLNVWLPMKKSIKVEMYMTTKNTMTLGYISDVLRIDTGQLRSLHSPSSLLVLANTAGKRLLAVTWICQWGTDKDSLSSYNLSGSVKSYLDEHMNVGMIHSGRVGSQQHQLVSRCSWFWGWCWANYVGDGTLKQALLAILTAQRTWQLLR